MRDFQALIAHSTPLFTIDSEKKTIKTEMKNY